MDARMAALVRSLAAQRRGGVGGTNLNGAGGRALPFGQGVGSPLGLGGYWSTPISFNPAGGGFAGNAALSAGTAPAGAADTSNAGIGGTVSTSATPSPGGGATQGDTATTPGWYQSDPSAPSASPWIPPTFGAYGSNPGAAPAAGGGNGQYAGLNAGDPSDPFNFRYLYQRQFG